MSLGVHVRGMSKIDASFKHVDKSRLDSTYMSVCPLTVLRLSSTCQPKYGALNKAQLAET